MWPQMWLHCRVLCLERIISFLLCTIEALDLTLVSRPPNITYVELGKTLTLNVTYETSSNVVVTWSKNAKILITSDLGPNDPRASIKGQGTLVLINTTSSDNGIYKHQARTLTSTEDIELVVVIQEQPTAVINCSSPVTVKEDGHFECLCNSTGGNPPPTASWYKDGKVVSGPGKEKTTLSLKNITGNDTGNYSCFVESYDLNDTKSVEIEVLLQPTAVINCPIKNTVKEGDDFNCLCNSAGGNPPPIASWYKDGKVLSGPGYLKTILSLKNINGSDTGNYSCIVESHDLNDTKSVEIQVQYKPRNIFIKSDQHKNICPVGKKVIITCKADAFPEPNYTITRNGNYVPDVVDGVTTMQSANLTDDGRYECVAKNSVGSVSASFNLTVNVQPFAVTNCSTSLKVNEGDDVVCLCNSKVGNPPPTASWYKNGMVVNGAGDLKNMLSLKNISRNDNRTYSCVVKSLDLSDATKVVIQVQYEPKIFSFKSDQEYNIVNVGKTVRIICKAEGFPGPNYTIFHNGIKVTDNAVKIIKSVNIRDGGRYECVTKNNLGQFSASFNLTVTVTVKEASSSNNTDTCTKWYFIVIAFISGIFVGMILLYAILSLRQRFKSKKDVSKPAHNYDTPETHPEGAADNSAYQELDLRNKEPENSYQALRMNTRRRIDNETKIEGEANYQELDKVREKENNYQSLNRV